jgi:aminoglycoside phosphotransferase family enzyme/predicted kinase
MVYDVIAEPVFSFKTINHRIIYIKVPSSPGRRQDEGKLMTELNSTTQKQLINALIPLLQSQFNKPVELVETHISTLLLVGDQAFKIKKPVDFGFLNFTQLQQRKFYCEEELRLNRRLAPKIYQQVLAITGDITNPQITGTGEAIEYMVKMKRFDQQELFDQKLKSGSLNEQHVKELSVEIAKFHQCINIADNITSSENIDAICNATIQNFDQLQTFIETLDFPEQQIFSRLEYWSRQQNELLAAVFKQRLASGFIRECHGDMHLGNITICENRVTIFDGIEFNPSFRWIDVMSEIAFITMDLQSVGKTDFANLLLNNYLELTGDYHGLQLLRYYQIYRAMVRAKVTSLRLGQLHHGDNDYQHQLKQLKHYLQIADHYTQQNPAKLMITHGVSGTGKSYATNQLLTQYPFIRIRSDVERKRLYPSADERYSKDASQNTYKHLHDVARSILHSGYSVIIDATYLEQQYRNQAAQVARSGNHEFLILSLQYPTDILEQRINQRLHNENDASEATIEVLHKQLARNEPLTEEEQSHSLVISENNDILERISVVFEGLK